MIRLAHMGLGVHWLSCVKITQFYVVGSKSFRPDYQKPRQMGNAVTVI